MGVKKPRVTSIRMNNTALLRRTKRLVATERRISVAILDCLYEIEVRRAYAELKYEGLYTYCVKELRFTETQAYQRCQAMRAMKDLPELKPMIESGSLSVSSVSMVHSKSSRFPVNQWARFLNSFGV
jgi:hypothetical protein